MCRSQGTSTRQHNKILVSAPALSMSIPLPRDDAPPPPPGRNCHQTMVPPTGLWQWQSAGPWHLSLQGCAPVLQALGFERWPKPEWIASGSTQLSIGTDSCLHRPVTRTPIAPPSPPRHPPPPPHTTLNCLLHNATCSTHPCSNVCKQISPVHPQLCPHPPLSLCHSPPNHVTPPHRPPQMCLGTMHESCLEGRLSQPNVQHAMRCRLLKFGISLVCLGSRSRKTACNGRRLCGVSSQALHHHSLWRA